MSNLQDRRQEVPDPAHHLKIGKISLPQLMYPAARVLDFIQHGMPTKDLYGERFNRTYRGGILNMYVFQTLSEVRERTENREPEYNEERAHDSLCDLTHWEYLGKHERAGNSNFGCH